MTQQRIGILHPGEMGISVAASAQNSGHLVFWSSAGRSSQTNERAEKRGLHDAGDLTNLYNECSVLISVCPPHAAEDVAGQVSASSFKGIFVDANAISPQRVVRIGELMAKRGISFVDGGIIGLPAWKPGTTCLYLSGERAAEVAACFSAGPLGTHLLGPAIGRASALKMCYAAYTKGTAALLCGILGTAENLGVREELFAQWKREDSKFADDSVARVRFVSTKAWRWSAEMDEISSTFTEAGMPGGFHAAAAEIYRLLAGFKDAGANPPLEEVLSALLRSEKLKTRS
jgi:3-hydroxyisobutyrate dehydrogenase-like beta-hydroxyacid dehydrogenase